ncbi:hypothetical protein D3C84_1145950 [compost metagenome]
MNIQHTAADEELINSRVEIAVVGDVVDMSISIIVHPAGLDLHQQREVGFQKALHTGPQYAAW